jgi:hypothetical protein
MSTRRYFLMGLGSFASGVVSVRADELCAAFTKDAQAEITSEQALENIRPAVSEVTDAGGPRNSKNKKFVQTVSERNITDAVSQLTTRSKILARQLPGIFWYVLLVGGVLSIATVSIFGARQCPD